MADRGAQTGGVGGVHLCAGGVQAGLGRGDLLLGGDLGQARQSRGGVGRRPLRSRIAVWAWCSACSV
ncbi:hypothetical protein HFP72_02385 [Nocardiopsis sp. ARC36]